MEISIIINQLITLFLVIGLGFFLKKVNLMPDAFNKQVTKLLLYVTMPCLIISSVLGMENRPSLQNILICFLIAIIMYSFLPIIGFILTKILFVPQKQVGLYIFMATFLNVGFMGFPLINALLGAEAMLYTSIINIVFNLCSFSYGLLLMNIGSDNEIKLTPKRFLTPGLILSIVAIIIYFINPTVPGCVSKSIEYVGSLTTPLAMLVIGTSLANIGAKELFSDWRLYVFTLLKQILIPIAVSPILKYFIHDSILLYVVFIMISVPIANSSVLFATEYGNDVKLAAKGVFISTLFSLFTIPLVVMICFG